MPPLLRFVGAICDSSLRYDLINQHFAAVVTGYESQKALVKVEMQEQRLGSRLDRPKRKHYRTFLNIVKHNLNTIPVKKQAIWWSNGPLLRSGSRKLQKCDQRLARPL